MGDYYYCKPICPNCKKVQEEYVTASDDPEMGDSHCICNQCGKRITVKAHMKFDYSIEEELPDLPF